MGVEGLEGSDGEFVVWAVGWEVGGCEGVGVEGEGCGEKGRGWGGAWGWFFHAANPIRRNMP